MILYKEPENVSLAMRSATNDVAIDNISKWRHIGRDRGGALQTAHENDYPLAFSLLFLHFKSADVNPRRCGNEEVKHDETNSYHIWTVVQSRTN